MFSDTLCWKTAQQAVNTKHYRLKKIVGWPLKSVLVSLNAPLCSLTSC